MQVGPISCLMLIAVLTFALPIEAEEPPPVPVSAPTKTELPVPVSAPIKTELPLLPLEERGGKAVAITESLFGDTTPKLAIRLHNTGAETVEVEPIYAGAARVDKAENQTYQISVASPRTTTFPAQQIAPGAVNEFDLALPNLSEPGIYSVETIFRSPTGKYKPYTARTTVYRREAVWLAAFFVLFGAALAFLVRWFVSGGNERLALRRRTALLLENIRAFKRGARREELIGAAAVLELDVRERDRDTQWGGKTAELERVITRAESRLKLLYEIAAVGEQLKNIDIDKQTPGRKTIDEALVVVRIDPGEESRVSAQREAISKLSLITVRRDQLKTRLNELNQQLELQKKVGSATLKAELRQLGQDLALADAALRDDRIEELDTLVTTVRGKVLTAGIAELGRLAHGNAPLGVEKATWDSAVVEIKEQLSEATSAEVWDRKNANFQSAQKVYFQTAVAGLASEASKKAKTHDSRAARFLEIATELSTKLSKDPFEAALIYPARLMEVTAPDPEGLSDRSTSSVKSGWQSVSGWLPLLLSLADSAAAEWAKTPTAQSGTAKIQGTITTYSWLVNAAVVVIAVSSGVKTLWLDNLAWGGHGAWLMAFLWGAGVQATGDAFAGLIGVRGKLSGAPPSG